MASLQRRIAVVTGASSGIGAGKGAALVITGRNADRLEQVRQQCMIEGVGDVLTVIAKIEDMDDIHKVAESTFKQFGSCNILVNNAGQARTGGLEACSLQDLDVIMTQQVKAPFLLSKLLLPELIKNKGCIVNVCSIYAQNPYPAKFAYSLAKGTLLNMSKCMALDLLQKGVRVNAVSPGYTRTGQLKSHGFSKEQIEQFEEGVKATLPTIAASEPQELASVISFLVSDESSSISGQELCVDKGVSLANSFSCRPVGNKVWFGDN